ncbi:MAG: flagellar assembly protein FliW [Vallitalea sp.]|jgi:flagellar assembly factor FliW|nr:flagellar assembly protein FliW [Vallitalea sp.]
MLVETKYFDKVEVEDSRIINFEHGVFGFSEYHKFVVLYENEILCWLQSIEDRDVVLPMICTPLVFPKYTPEVDDEIILSIGDMKQDNYLSIFTIMVVPSDIEKMTTNLKAPIIINNNTKKGIQVILESDEYEIKHNLYERLRQSQSKQKVGE